MSNLGAVQVIITTVLLTLEDGELRVVLTPDQSDAKTGQFGHFDEDIRGNEDIDLEEIVRRSLERRQR